MEIAKGVFLTADLGQVQMAHVQRNGSQSQLLCERAGSTGAAAEKQHRNLL